MDYNWLTPKAEAQAIRVERNYAPDLPQVWVDGPHIKTCFLNLVLNALQAMTPDGGTLTVTAHITFNSAVDGNPASGRTVTVDGGNQTTSYSTDWVVGSTGHTIDAPDPQSGAAGVQYAWVSWSGTPSNTNSRPSPVFRVS